MFVHESVTSVLGRKTHAFNKSRVARTHFQRTCPGGEFSFVEETYNAQNSRNGKASKEL